MKYISKSWLSQNLSHSSSYIVFHYDMKCRNKHFKMFIRVADCHDIVDFKFSTKDSMRNFAKDIIEVVSGKATKKSRRIKCYTYKLFVTDRLYADRDDSQCLYFLKRVIKDYNKEYCLIHKDSRTCDEVEWKEKLKTIQSEAEKFLINVQ